MSLFRVYPNIIHSGQPSLIPPSLSSRRQNPGATHKLGSSSSAGCEFHRQGCVSSSPGPPPPPGPLLLGSYLHAGHRQCALQPVLPVLLGVRVQQHITHLGRGDPVRRVLGPEGTCWACPGASLNTSISHSQGPGEQGHSGLKQETPSPQFHMDTEEQTHTCPQEVRDGDVGMRFIQHHSKGKQPKHLSVGIRTRNCELRHVHSSQPHSNQRADRTRLTTGLSLQDTPARRSRTVESTWLHNMYMKLQNSSSALMEVRAAGAWGTVRGGALGNFRGAGYAPYVDPSRSHVNMQLSTDTNIYT